MKKSSLVVCAVAIIVITSFIAFPSLASALLLQIDSTGQLTGATEVDVLGSLYDVEFIGGSCISSFGGCDESSDFIFITRADAIAASNALLTQVLLDSALGQFDYDPALTYGCSDWHQCAIMTPYSYDETDVWSVAADNKNAGYLDYAQDYAAALDYDVTNVSLYMFADWTPSSSSSPVTEPATMILLGSGLFGLGTFRRKFKQ